MNLRQWLVHRALELDAGQLEVAVATSATAGILPRVLYDWQQRHPRIEVSLFEFPHRRALVEAVRDGTGEIAVSALPESSTGQVQQLGWEEFVVVLAAGDPLFAAAGIGPTIVPEHVVTAALAHLARPTEPPTIRAVCAFSRGDWTPLTAAFLETLRAFPWGPKPSGAVDLT